MKNFIQHTAESMDQNESSHQLELPVIDETIDGSKLIESINKALYIIGKRTFKKLYPASQDDIVEQMDMFEWK